MNISKSGISTNIGIKGASVTFGPKGTYVNTGLPGTGLYRRDRVSDEGSNSVPNYEPYIPNDEDVSMENLVTHGNCFKITKNGTAKIPVFKPQYYLAFIIALTMPFIGLTLYAYGEWWMFFSCLLVDFVQLMCWVSGMDPDNTFDGNSCYKIIEIQNNRKIIKKEKVSTITSLHY